MRLSIFVGIILTSSFALLSCKSQENQQNKKEVPILWNYDDSSEVNAQQSHANRRMQFKLLTSKYLDYNDVYEDLYWEVQNFPNDRYETIRPLILEKNIPSIQESIRKGDFTYEELSLFFLKRIYKYELNPELSLYTIISLNPNILDEAREKDKNRSQQDHPIYGMPILLKDNINTLNLPTTAGAKVLEENRPTQDAFVVQQLKKNGALILGKVNLSEWAYYFCSGCPLGYSAVGGQTLNPYGRKVFETGGSSAGSGTSVAANYAIAAVGTETSGSIISPTSQNSIVGLKPTIGVISRTGIVPISHTLDTSGPMTKNVIDNAILLDAMSGEDATDSITIPKKQSYVLDTSKQNLSGKRLGVMNNLMTDSIYSATVEKLERAGATIIKYDAPQLPLPGFLTLLNLEMKEDLPNYLRLYASENIRVKTLQDIIAYNKKDSVGYMPYSQELFDGIIADTTSFEDFQKIKSDLSDNGKRFFEEPFREHNLDAIVSINNYHSGYAAVGKHPCLAIPMGYKENGEPVAMTFIGEPFKEKELLEIGYAYELINPVRKPPILFTK